MVTILSLLSCLWGSSEGDREFVDAVVRGTDCLFDESEPACFIQRAPGSRGGPHGVELGDLLDGSVFVERTGAEAISHGKSPARFWWPPAGRAVRGGLSPPATCRLSRIPPIISPIKHSTEAINCPYQLS